MSDYMEEVRRVERQRKLAMATSRAPFLLVPDGYGEQVLVDVAAIRSVVPWVRPSDPPGAIIGLYDDGELGEVRTALTVVALARLLSWYGIGIIDASVADHV